MKELEKYKKIFDKVQIQADNLDRIKLKVSIDGHVVVENEHGTQFPVSELSDVELDIFYTNLI